MPFAGTLWILPQCGNFTGSGPSRISGSAPGPYLAASSSQIRFPHSGHNAVATSGPFLTISRRLRKSIHEDPRPRARLSRWGRRNRPQNAPSVTELPTCQKTLDALALSIKISYGRN
jgi:hypothetical protein